MEDGAREPGAHDADSRGGKARPSVRFWSRRSKKKEEEEKGGEEKIVVSRFDGPASLLPSMKRKNLEERWRGVDRPRGLCWYAWNRKQDGGGKKKEEGNSKRARLGTRGEERRSREEGKIM